LKSKLLANNKQSSIAGRSFFVSTTAQESFQRVAAYGQEHVVVEADVDDNDMTTLNVVKSKGKQVIAGMRAPAPPICGRTG
jgi:hypothetical protein